MRNVRVMVAVLICGICCGFDAQPTKPPKNQPTKRSVATRPGVLVLAKVPHWKNLQQPQNLLQVSSRIYSGGEPQGDDDFARLARLGIRTVVSVDGAKPDVAAALKHSMRYIHIPLGYDGVSEHAGLSLSRLVREVPGPIFIHCHHGRHRAPAAVAIACIAEGTVDGKAALKILEKAGTGKGYTGLWEDVKSFRSPPLDAELPALRATAEVDSLITAMVQIDRAIENLRLCEQNNWNTPPQHPDVTAARETLLLQEGFRESARLFSSTSAQDQRLVQWLGESENTAKRLAQALDSNQKQDARKQFVALEQQCKRCHDEFRN